MILFFKVKKRKTVWFRAAGMCCLLVLMMACGKREELSVMGAADSQSSAIDRKAITEIVKATMEETLTPGVVVLIRKGDEEWLEAFGFRNADKSEALSIEDHFRIGSNTKTWTGTVLLQLVDEGLISLKDSVGKYIEGIPNGDNISIEQLLTMRSGLFNYSELESFNRILDEQPGKVWGQRELLKLAFENKPYFAPGESFHYSNTNTVLAGLIIEKLTGKKVNEVFETRIFSKLGLKQSLIPAVEDASMPKPHSQGYLYGDNVSTLPGFELSPDEQKAARSKELKPNDVTNMNPSWGWTAGAGISTAGDLAVYVKALVGGGLLSAELQSERINSLRSTDPSNPASASYGLALAKFGPLIGHDGSLPGFQSFMAYDAENDVTVIVLANLQGGVNGEEPANAIVKKVTPLLYGNK